MKKILIAILIIVLAAAAIYAGYLLRKRIGGETGEPSGGGLPGGGLSGGGAGSFPTSTASGPGGGGVAGGVEAPKLQFADEVAGFYLRGEDDFVYARPDGKIFSWQAGTATELSTSTFAGLTRADFSYDGKKVLAAYENRIAVFDLNTRGWRALPDGAFGAAWSPTSYEAAYLLTKTWGESLAVLDFSKNNTSPRELAVSSFKDSVIEWPSPGIIMIRERSSVAYRATLWRFDLKSKTLLLVREVLGLDSSWSYASNGLVFESNVSRRGGTVSLVSANGRKIKDLELITLPSAKCASIFWPAEHASSTNNPGWLCGIPLNGEDFAIAALPDAYFMKSLYAADDLYFVNATDGEITLLASVSSNWFDVTKPALWGNKIYFVSRFDNKLYSLEL